MKVSDVMQHQVEYITPDAPVSEIARLIFGRGINGVPVCTGRKLIGMITERDILDRLYPSMQDYVEDYAHARDFEAMEGNIEEILNLSAEKIMNKSVTSVKGDMPLLRAQVLMKVKKVGRLPVVDGDGNLIGILSKGDIFRAVVGQKLPLGEEERFYDWMARHYDVFIDWNKRLSGEIPHLVKLFRKEKVQSVIDVASSTGEHSTALAKQGFNVFGLETSSLMCDLSEEKKARLGKNIAGRVHFLQGRYEDTIKKLPPNVDAAIFMGNALPHVLYTDKNILREICGSLKSKKSLLVFQLVNFEKIFEAYGGLQDFTISDTMGGQRHAFLGFYTKEKKGNVITFTRAIFDFDGNHWIFKGMHTTPVVYIGQKEILAILKKLGFSQISLFGSPAESLLYGSLLGKPFKARESNQLNVLAKR